MELVDVPWRSSGNEAEQDDDAGELNHPQKDLCFDFVPRADTPEALQPGDRPFHCPPPSVAAQGLRLEAGLVDVRDGAVMVRRWSPASGVTWADPLSWTPYQASTFVSPAFPAFVSGHSTFSRAAAQVLTDLTGSAFFPGGLHEVVARPGHVSIDGRTNATGLRLQWATDFDAADQAGQSRIWGGIHIEPDDLVGRRIGQQIGLDAVALARTYCAGGVR